MTKKRLRKKGSEQTIKFIIIQCKSLKNTMKRLNKR